jgi:hypothetical protein
VINAVIGIVSVVVYLLAIRFGASEKIAALVLAVVLIESFICWASSRRLKKQEITRLQ